jgi:hypothetical protein
VWPLMESWGPATLPALLRAVRRADPAVVHLHYPTEEYGRFSAIDWLPLAVRALLRRPVVATIHEYGTFRRLGRRRVEMLARTSTAVIVPDRQNLEALAAAMPSLRPRLHHVPLGPALEPALPPDYDRRQWRAGRGIGAETLVLAYFGFITPSKGVELLLAALDHLPAELDLHLWLLAGHEPSHPRYAGYHAAAAEAAEGAVFVDGSDHRSPQQRPNRQGQPIDGRETAVFLRRVVQMDDGGIRPPHGAQQCRQGRRAPALHQRPHRHAGIGRRSSPSAGNGHHAIALPDQLLRQPLAKVADTTLDWRPRAADGDNVHN